MGVGKRGIKGEWGAKWGGKEGGIRKGKRDEREGS